MGKLAVKACFWGESHSTEMGSIFHQKEFILPSIWTVFHQSSDGMVLLDFRGTVFFFPLQEILGQEIHGDMVSFCSLWYVLNVKIYPPEPNSQSPCKFMLGRRTFPFGKTRLFFFGPQRPPLWQAFLYGELITCTASRKYKATMCTRRNCPQRNCDFLHPGEESQGDLTKRNIFVRSAKVTWFLLVDIWRDIPHQEVRFYGEYPKHFWGIVRWIPSHFPVQRNFVWAGSGAIASELFGATGAITIFPFVVFSPQWFAPHNFW